MQVMIFDLVILEKKLNSDKQFGPEFLEKNRKKHDFL